MLSKGLCYCSVVVVLVYFIVQSTPFNRNPVNRNFRKWVGCEALASIQDNDICHHNEPLSCMGAKASQPTRFLKFRLTGFRLNGVDCNCWTYSVFVICGLGLLIARSSFPYSALIFTPQLVGKACQLRCCFVSCACFKYALYLRYMN